MITEALIAALTSLIAGMTGVSQVFIELFYRKKEILKKDKKQQEILSNKIAKLTDSLHESSALMAEIEEEFERQKKLAEEWKEQEATSKIIASMNQDEIDAVAKIFGGQLENEAKKSGRSAIIQNIIFCILGIIGGYLISKILP